jgi:hypothetical protein
VRIKSKWHNKSKAKSVEEIAGALGFITWRIAANAVNKMYTSGFDFTSNKQQLDVIAEFLAFLVQAADRRVHDIMDDEERRRFITALALHVAGTLEDNLREEVAPGDYRADFINLLNERMEAYSEFNFVDGVPSYPSMRYFATGVDAVMGGEENKWVIEQVIEVEAPEAMKNFNRAINDLLEGRKPQID